MYSAKFWAVKDHCGERHHKQCLTWRGKIRSGEQNFEFSHIGLVFQNNFTLILLILCAKIKYQKIAPGVEGLLSQAGFIHKFCHFQNSWLIPNTGKWSSKSVQLLQALQPNVSVPCSNLVCDSGASDLAQANDTVTP